MNQKYLAYIIKKIYIKRNWIGIDLFWIGIGIGIDKFDVELELELTKWNWVELELELTKWNWPHVWAVHIVTTRLQTTTFMAVQFAYIRGVCRVEEAKISNDALVELCYIRALAIKTQLVSPHYRAGDHNVRYTEAVAYLETGPDVPPGAIPNPPVRWP